MLIQCKRVYSPVEKNDGYRYWLTDYGHVASRKRRWYVMNGIKSLRLPQNYATPFIAK